VQFGSPYQLQPSVGADARHGLLRRTRVADESTFDRVKRIVMDVLAVDDEAADRVTEDASFADDLGLDSLDAVELLMAFEEEFNISIDDEQADAVKTVGDAVKFIEKAVS
jgi:acyl carrier protein